MQTSAAPKEHVGKKKAGCKKCCIALNLLAQLFMTAYKGCKLGVSLPLLTGAEAVDAYCASMSNSSGNP